ncbi:MAG: hypothetical protein KAG28_08150 [Cocleimonas sp.]|nr:hypothetical protein [Cocleimonas sp.]
MTRSNNIILLLLLGLTFALQGCGVLTQKQVLKFWQKDKVIRPSKTFRYDIKEPVRKPLSPARVKSLRLKSPVAVYGKTSRLSSRQYYSASGYVCRILDRSGREIVCAVSGRWKRAPVILANSRLR